MPYHKKQVDITWEKCSLRQWLNSSFFDSLPAQVRSRVVEVVNQNPDNKEYKTSGGNQTRDKVFLLSLDEVNEDLKSAADRVAKFNGSSGWWWLRSPGDYQVNAAGVYGDGDVDDDGYRVSFGIGGVRPALFLYLGACHGAGIS
jgi:hypothetical protein